MEKTYKFRIYPTKGQEVLISKTFGCVRYVYNYFLNDRKVSYAETGKSPTRFQQDKMLTELKKQTDWLREPDKCALQASLKNLDRAYQDFFREIKKGNKHGFPRFKSKHDNRQSFKTTNNGKTIYVTDNAVRLPKLGLVKCRVSKKVEGRILSATVSRNPSGKYFVAISCTDVEIEPLPKTGSAVGIDLGIKSFAVTADGVEYPAHKFLRKSEKKLAKLQRQLSRKQKGSNNRNKARIKVARLHEKIRNQRTDTLHKLSTELIKNYDVICIEDLSVKNMVKNHKLAKSILDSGWGEFRRQLKYKANWYGKQISVVDRFYPSSQLCSVCGEKWSGTKDLTVRSWTCPNCNTTLDRDINASINILNEGLRIIA